MNFVTFVLCYGVRALKSDNFESKMSAFKDNVRVFLLLDPKLARHYNEFVLATLELMKLFIKYTGAKILIFFICRLEGFRRLDWSFA